MSAPKIPAAKRREYILKAIQRDGFIAVIDMAKTLRTSEMTLRRDLNFLAENEQLTRTHGGAISPGHLSGLDIDLVEPSVSKRSTRHHDAKIMIARTASQMLLPGQTIALDIGTTTFELATLVRDIPLRVFTNSLKIAKRINQSKCSIYMPGGQINGTEPSLVGSRTIKDLNDFFFDIAFIGVSGLSIDGFYDYSFEDTEIKKALIARSKTSVVLLDSSKFDRMSVALVAKMEDIDVLITDKQPPEILNQVLETSNVCVVVARTITSKEL